MSKKSNLERKKKKKQYLKAKRSVQTAQREEEVHPELLERLKDDELPNKNVRIGKLKKKASETILEFAGPLLEEAESDEETEHAVHFSILAWNIASLPEDSRAEALRDLFNREYFNKVEKEIIYDFIARKDNLFSGHLIFIRDYQVDINEKGQLHLSVAAIGLEDLLEERMNSKDK